MNNKRYDQIWKYMKIEMGLFLPLFVNYCKIIAKKVDFGRAGSLILGF